MDQISFGNTNVSYGDSTELLYLRARHYAPGMGRFLTRDTWGGDVNSPLSFNRWNYVQANPINYLDPTGHIPECVETIPASRINVDYADKHVNLSKTDWLNTYAAAGIAVQCWADLLPLWDENTSGQGPAQVSNLQITSPYGETIKVGGGENGFGIRCYIKLGLNKNPPCTFCLTTQELKNMSQAERNKYHLEPIHNQNDIAWAAIYIKRKIAAVINSCRGYCTATDKFIAAALGQGSGFTPEGMSQVSNPKPFEYAKYGITTHLYVIPLDQRHVTIDWQKYFDVRDHPRATSAEVARFVTAVRGLSQKGWILPGELINWNYVYQLK